MERFRQVEDKIADAITAFAGSMWFVYVSAFGFFIWMVFVERDPWPTLTLAVSLEAIFLTTFVMISQNRQAAVADKRAEKDFQTDRKAEHEIEKMHQELVEIKALVLDIAAEHREQTDELHKRISFINRPRIEAKEKK